MNESYSGGIAAMDEKKSGYNDDPKHPVNIESGEIAPAYDDEGPVEFEEKKDLKRGLKQRHIQMIALAGTIGTVRSAVDLASKSVLTMIYRDSS